MSRYITATEELDGIVASPFGKPVTKLSLKTVDNFFRPALKILQAIHEVEYVHRDVKPQNFIWSANKLLLNDFDLAAKKVSNSGFTGGTERYSSPLLGRDHTYDEKDDILSLILSAIDLIYPALLDGRFNKVDLFKRIIDRTIMTTELIHSTLVEAAPTKWMEESDSKESVKDEGKPTLKIYQEE